MAERQNRSGSHQKPALGSRLARSQPGLAARVGLKGQGQDERPKTAGLDPSPRGGLIGPATGGSENQTGSGHGTLPEGLVAPRPTDDHSGRAPLPVATRKTKSVL
jgi:hypothetical protein